jgi:molybdopterin synthase sulfur carrier subunit
MTLTIKLFATFRNGRFKETQKEVTDNSTLGQVIADLGIAESEIGMALVNGRHASMGQGLNDGHVLALFPLLGGG